MGRQKKDKTDMIGYTRQTRQTSIQTPRLHRQRDIQPEKRQTNTHTERQTTNRHTDRQKEREKHRQTHTMTVNDMQRKTGREEIQTEQPDRKNIH